MSDIKHSAHDLAIQKGFADVARKKNMEQEMISALERLKSNPAMQGLLNYKVEHVRRSGSTYLHVKLGSVKVVALGIKTDGTMNCFTPDSIYAVETFSDTPEKNTLAALQFVATQAGLKMDKAVARQNSKVRKFFRFGR